MKFLPSRPQKSFFGAIDDSRSGMLIMATAMLYVPLLDVFAKLLTDYHAPVQIAWFRYLVQFCLLLPFALYFGSWPSRQALIGFMIRAFLAVAATVSIVNAVKIMPVADAITIFFIEPLVLTLLAALFLGEKIGIRRISAVVIGFIGAVIALQPSFDDVGFGVLYPVGAAVFFSGYLLMTRYFSAKESVFTMQTFTAGFAFVILSIALAFGNAAGVEALAFTMPEGKALLFIAAVGLIATLGHMQIVLAFRRAEAGLLAPFQYLEIITATLFGYLVFGDFPAPLTWLGVAIIIGSGIYVFHRESVVNKQKQTPEASR